LGKHHALSCKQLRKIGKSKGIFLLKGAGERPQSYSSPAIIARRKRILEETRKAIAEKGIDALSMNEIGKRAKVAKRTLYNAFQTRDRMVGAAIQEYFDDFIDSIHHNHLPGTTMYNLERLVSVGRRNPRIRNYARAVMAIYYSADGEDDIWRAMHTMAARPNRLWLRSLRDQKQLQPWADVDLLTEQLVCIEYAVINEWTLDRITDDQVTVRLATTSLTHMLCAARGAARKEIEDLLIRIGQEGEDALPQPQNEPPDPTA
jgi:AcrR family transcriptional regulator